MQHAWASFAWNGAPDLDGEGWPAHTAADPNYAVLGLAPYLEDSLREDRCDGLRALGLAPPEAP
jgi:hypothetical protein